MLGMPVERRQLRSTINQSKKTYEKSWRLVLLLLRWVVDLPADPLAILVRPVAAHERLVGPLNDRRPAQIPLVLLHALAAPVELLKVALVVAPPTPVRVLARKDGDARRQARDERLGRGRARSVGGRRRGGGARSGESGELGGDDAASGDALAGGESGAEVGEVARRVERAPPSAKTLELVLSSWDEERGRTGCGSGTRSCP